MRAISYISTYELLAGKRQADQTYVQLMYVYVGQS